MLPIRLSNLALEAFGKYVSHIQEKLAALSEDTSMEMLNSEHLDPICRKLEEIIQKAVPINLADHVTENLMAHILKTYNYLEKRISKRREIRKLHLKYRHIYKHISIRLCLAVLHSFTNKFKFSRLQFPTVNHVQARIFIDDFLKAILKKISHVRFLQLEIHDFDNEIVAENIKLMNNLEELTFFGCTDLVMAVVSESCSKLKYLDLSNSKKITNCSVEYILKLTNLDHLMIERTQITSHGIEMLFQRDSNFEVSISMQSLCCRLESHHVEFVPTCFPNLTTLEFYDHEQFSLVPLKELENLTNLGISFAIVHTASSICLEEFLQAVGPQLIYLKLADFREEEFIDIFRIVAENCTRLENLVMKIVPFYISYEESDLISARNLPVMNSLNFCDLKVSYAILLKAILPKLVNVKYLKCYSYDDGYNSFVMDLLLDLKASKYNKLNVYDTVLQNSGENIIITRNVGSYVFAHWGDLGFIVSEIMRERNFEFRENCFQDVTRYTYGWVFLENYFR